jgi:hypothetical protein
MMRRTGLEVKSLPIIHVIGAFLDWNMTEPLRPAASRRFPTSLVIVKRQVIRSQQSWSASIFGDRSQLYGQAEIVVTRLQQNACKWPITYI